ncbi:unnamed protein product [Trichogramma brassicae]|uniref:Reverse transcriptase domain-containing protein n=1 Tax=Trichogramma brassicae TaxID=86971 RepID=A0A6H5I6Z6_9HYME|nr:unnamed protein product [Trichogramma brassicae]
MADGLRGAQAPFADTELATAASDATADVRKEKRKKHVKSRSEHLDRLGNKIDELREYIDKTRGVQTKIKDLVRSIEVTYESVCIAHDYVLNCGRDEALEKATQTSLRPPVAKKRAKKTTASTSKNAGTKGKQCVPQRSSTTVNCNGIETPQKGHREAEERWTKVVGKNTKTAENAGGRRWLRRVRPTAVLVKAANGASYADILRNVKSDPVLKEFSAGVTKIRRNAEGALLFELSKEARNTQGMVKAVASRIGNEVEVWAKTQRVTLTVSDMDEVTTKDDHRAPSRVHWVTLRKVTLKSAQDMLQCIVEERKIDVVIISEQYRDRDRCCWALDAKSLAAVWAARDKRIEARSNPRTEMLAWAKVEGLYIFSVYAPPRLSNEQFEALLYRLEREAAGKRPAIIAGDFNAWSTEWGSRRNTARGDMLLECMASLDMCLLNTGKKHRRRRGNGKWNIKSFDEETFKVAIAEDRIIAGCAAEKAKKLMGLVSYACDASMARSTQRKARPPVYWWNVDIARLREGCISARRIAQRARIDRAHYHERYKEARAELRRAIKNSKRQCWKDLVQSVDDCPWGRPYKIVMNKLQNQATQSPTDLPLVTQIVRTLFPSDAIGTGLLRIEGRENPRRVPPVTMEEFRRAMSRIRDAAAPGPDGVPNKVLKLAMQARPELFLDVYNACLTEGVFPACWKMQRLVLLPKGDKPPEEPSSYRPLCMLNTAGKILERIICNRIEEHTETETGLSEMQFGFRKSRSTIDAIRIVVETARSAIAGRRWRRVTKNYCAIITLDVKNAFNSARWSRVLQALRNLGVPDYVLKLIRSYFSERILLYHTDEGTRRYKVTAGVPQGSVLGPTLWNIMYDGVLRVQFPQGVEIVGYADDIAIVVTAKHLEDVTLKANRAIRII